MKTQKRAALAAVGVVLLSTLVVGGTSGAATPRSKAPGVPTSLVATPLTTAISVSWSAPISTGGSPILGYLATTAPGSASCSAIGTTSCLIVGLADGVGHTVHVQAVNKAGRSKPASIAGVKPTTAQNCVYRGPYANLKSCDLTGANLSGVDLTDADLAHADLEGANLTGATLTGANLNGADLAGSTLAGTSSSFVTGIVGALPASWELSDGFLVGPDADLDGADLNRAHLAGAELAGAELVGADVDRADLAGADLDGADLTGADLDGADLDTADLAGADLSGADLSGADITNVNLSSADLAGLASGGMIGTPSTLPTGWDLVEGYLVGPDADLAGAELVGADLSSTDLAGADLSDADLSGADITSASMAGAVMAGLVSGAIVGTPSTLPTGWDLVDGYLIGPDADLVNADLVGANLRGRDLAGADLSDADLSDADVSGADTVATIWSNTTCPDGTDSDNDGGTCMNNPSANAAAQDDLNTALTNVKSYYDSNSQYFGPTNVVVAALAVQEPELSFSTGPSYSDDQISVITSADGNGIILAAESATGDCWYIVDNEASEASATGPPWSEPGALFLGAGTIYGELKNVGTPPFCSASTAPAGPNSATQAFNTTGEFPDL